MKTLHWILSSGTAVWLCSLGCSQSTQKEAQDAVQKLNDAGKNLAKASEEVSRSLEEGGQGLADAFNKLQSAVGVDAAVEPADFRELKKALPLEFTGFTAGRATGERTKVMGIGSSKAEIRLSRNKDEFITIRIVDTGTISGLTALAGRATAAVNEVDRETETGFERMGVIDGIRTYESYDEVSGISSIRMFYGDRFSIELSGQNVAWADMERARDAVDKSHLDSLKIRITDTADSSAS